MPQFANDQTFQAARSSYFSLLGQIEDHFQRLQRAVQEMKDLRASVVVEIANGTEGFDQDTLDGVDAVLVAKRDEIQNWANSL